MILIISQDSHEHTTNHVIDWINHNGVRFKRLNGIDFYKNVNITIKTNEVLFTGLDIQWEELGAIWFRRWVSHENGKELLINKKVAEGSNHPMINSLNKFLANEFKTLTSYFFNLLPKEKSFDTIFDNEINKLTVLEKAKEYGLKIPDTYIFTKKKQFYNIKRNNNLITKPISNGTDIYINNQAYVGYTAMCDKFPLSNQKIIAPSLCQKHIIKQYEIRSFYLCGNFFSMAIFSQSDKQTEVDFRRYNHVKPNRMVPFQLPMEVEKKLNCLAKHFNLNSCSFDLIKTHEDKFIFLEVNPGGQFGMVSYPCNYYLEEKVAFELINLNKLNYEY